MYVPKCLSDANMLKMTTLFFNRSVTFKMAIFSELLGLQVL